MADHTAPATTPARAGLLGRALRGSAVTALGFAGGQALRLGANLILTRLLFPEAFGLMALVTVFMVGLSMLSDIGLGPAIHQNPRGDDPAFLGTAWTIQAARGMILFAAACAIAPAAAAFYAAPDLAFLLPAMAVTLLVGGLTPIRVETAVRHLHLGRLTAIELAAQVVGLVAMVALAWATRSVWALVAGAIAGSVARLALVAWLLPGPRVRAGWDRDAAGALIGFGKWVFLSTLCGFLLAQGDKAILGRLVTLDQLGIYNIGWFIASFPMSLGLALAGRVLIPIYRETAAEAGPAHRRLRRMRAGLTGLLMALLLALAFAATPLVALLYDARYAAAAGVVAALAAVQVVQVVGLSYDQAALAAGNSRGFFAVIALRSTVQTAAFLAGLAAGGLLAALAAQGVAIAVMHLAIVRLARRHGVWDPVHDAAALAIALPLAALALAVNREALALLAAFGG